MTKAEIKSLRCSLWQDPVFRNKVLAGMRNAKYDASERRRFAKACSLRMKRRWQDPEYSSKMGHMTSLALKGRPKNKISVRKQRASLRRRWRIDKKFRTRMLGIIGRCQRQRPNRPEKLMMYMLDSLQLKYIFQSPLFGFVPDFILESRKIVIEVDGLYWHSLPRARVRDKRKDLIFHRAGYTVLRFTDEEIMHHIDDVRCTLELI